MPNSSHSYLRFLPAVAVTVFNIGWDMIGYQNPSLGYVLWAIAALLLLIAAWPWLKRWRPLTLAPAGTQLSTPHRAKEVGAEKQKTNTENDELRAARERLERAVYQAKQENDSLRGKVRELEMMSPEENRAKQEERRKRIQSWRNEIRHITSTMDFTLTDTYIQMKPFMRPNVQQSLEYSLGMLIHRVNTMTSPRQGGLEGVKRMLLDEVARIEKEWGLV